MRLAGAPGRAAIICLILGLETGHPSPPPVVVSAYRSHEGILFDSARPLPWDSLLPGNLRLPALAAAPERRKALFRERSEYGASEVAFDLPLPYDLERRAYHLLDSTGVSEVHPSALRGMARIYWSDSAQVRTVEAYGQLPAPAPPGSNGGFILGTGGPVTLLVEPSQLSADGLLAPHGGTYQHQGTPFWEIIRQYRVRQSAPASDSWVWVQRRADTALVEAGCTLRFSLFHLEPDPVRLATTDTGCDV